ncbi:zinc finger CCCH domain-containing protein 3 isoform X2 [Festucalex cinctus]
MEQRESLKRQIDLLQNLIDKHKSVHGNVPRLPQASTTSTGGGQSASAINPHSLYAQASHGSWRKTYSLKNKNPVSAVSTSSLEQHSNVQASSHSASLRSHAGGKSGPPKLSSATSKIEHKKQAQSETRIQNVATERQDGCKKGAGVPQSVSFVQSQPFVTRQSDKTDTQHPADKKQIGHGASSLLQASPCKIPKQPFKHHPSSIQATTGRQTQSKFTWVKNPSVEQAETRPANHDAKVDSSIGAKASVVSASAFSAPVSKRTPAKKPRKLSPVVAGSRASKYKWVSSSVAGVQAKTLIRKATPPKAPPDDPRALEKGEATMKKFKSGSLTAMRFKKGSAASSTSSSSSRYHWKAAGREAAALWRSTFVWASERNSKGAKRSLVCASVPQGCAMQSSPNSFKLRSRMKIIRKSANSPTGSVSVKGGLSLAARHSPRGHVHNLARPPAGARRTPTKELVSFGRHKLRRLSPTSSRASATFSFHRPPASQRICRSQYKMVRHPGSGVAYTLPYHSTLSWRAKKIQSARSFLQSRQRSSLNRYPASAHHWKQSGMCWIRGSLYQVSANKLSRTVSHNMAINRTGRSFSQVSSVNSAPSHPYSPRHLASRAVQRSLAIIRQARQKKQQRQYCMYYNRFGKCNRGSSCPYVHDPDKVAVCTRFLRGTCKQADGTCPFSHKVAKEKMPVCSYFLKGICNNSDCPYSHVYVSRKAKVCEDFVKGYCPEGEKCKKKHSLVCPDFSATGSCARGARCKLQHRQRAERTASARVSKEPSKRPSCSSADVPQESQEAPRTPAASSLALPSFISLSSSPEEADAPEPLRAKTTPVKETQVGGATSSTEGRGHVNNTTTMMTMMMMMRGTKWGGLRPPGSLTQVNSLAATRLLSSPESFLHLKKCEGDPKYPAQVHRQESSSPPDRKLMSDTSDGNKMAAALLHLTCLYRGMLAVRASGIRPLIPGLVPAHFRAFSVRKEPQLEDNPYYDKYQEKIQKMRSCNPEEFKTRMEQRQQSKKEELGRSKQADFVRVMNRDKMAAGHGTSGAFAKNKSLDSILKLELIQDKTGDEIAQLWTKYFSSKDTISAVIPRRTYELVATRAKSCPTFLFALPQKEGYEFFVGQWSGHQLHFTSLINIQTHGENAPSQLILHHFVDLMEAKDVVLMTAQLDHKFITACEAQCLANQVQLFYGSEREETFDLVETFNRRPADFKHMSLIAQLERSGVGAASST